MMQYIKVRADASYIFYSPNHTYVTYSILAYVAYVDIENNNAK